MILQDLKMFMEGKILFIILKQDLLLAFHNLGKIIANFAFFLISIVSFLMILQNYDSTITHSLAIIWFSLLFCLIFSAVEFLKKDFDDGTVEQMIVTCANFETYTAAKMLANWLISALPILISIPIIAMIIGFEAKYNLLILAILASFAINFICTFCGSLSLLENTAPMIGLIAMPLIIPILLIAFSGIEPESFTTSLKILAGLDILLATISITACSKIVKIVSE